jgi:hypothetical protein
MSSHLGSSNWGGYRAERRSRSRSPAQRCCTLLRTYCLGRSHPGHHGPSASIEHHDGCVDRPCEGRQTLDAWHTSGNTDINARGGLGRTSQVGRCRAHAPFRRTGLAQRTRRVTPAYTRRTRCPSRTRQATARDRPRPGRRPHIVSTTSSCSPAVRSSHQRPADSPCRRAADRH